MSEKNFQKVLDVVSMTPEQLAEAQKLTNKTLRNRAAEIVARIDAGADVKAFVLAADFINDDDGPSVHAGGACNEEFRLIDIATFLITRASVESGSLVPQLSERMIAVNEGEAIPVPLMLKLAVDTARLVNSNRTAEQTAANEAESMIRRAAGPVGGSVH